MRAGFSPALLQRIRAVPSTARLYVEAAAVANGGDAEDTKDTAGEFQAADSFTGFETPVDGGVRLAGTDGTLLDQTLHDSNSTDLDSVSPFTMAKLVLSGPESADLGLRWITARLNPNTGAGQQVARWICQLYALQSAIGTQRTLVPLTNGRVEVTAGATEADVLFDFRSLSGGVPRIKAIAPVGDGTIRDPTLYVQIRALKSDGADAANVAWRRDSTHSTFGSPNILTLATLTEVSGPKLSTGQYVEGGVAAVPRIKVQTAGYAGATLPFTGAGNKLDVRSVPSSASAVRFNIKVAAPAGTSVTVQMKVAGGDPWVTVKDGQTAADVGLAASQTYLLQAIFAPNAGGDATPVLVRAGAEIVTLSDLSDVVRLGDMNAAIDPQTMRAEVTHGPLRTLHDGEPDYRDAGTELLSGNHLKDISIRIWVGAPDLSRDQWALLGEYLLDDTAGLGPEAELLLVSPTVQLLKQVLPVPTGSSPNLKRVPLVYNGSPGTATIQGVSDDVLDVRMALQTRWRGPGIADTTAVQKTITESTVKKSLEELAFIAGGAWIESQGRIKYVSLHASAGVVKIFQPEEIKQGRVSAGWSRRMPEVFLRYNHDRITDVFGNEAKFRNQTSYDRLGIYGSAAPPWLDDEVGKWITANATAKTVVERQARAFGMGEITVPFETTYSQYELELGDKVAIPTDRFMARDPLANRALRGQLYVVAVIVGVHGWHHKAFTACALGGFADIIGAAEVVDRDQFVTPTIDTLAVGLTTDRKIRAQVVGSIALNSIRIAVSKTAFPSRATVQAKTPLAATGHVVDTGAGGITLEEGGTVLGPTETAYLAVLGYENSDGTGSESVQLYQATVGGRAVGPVTVQADPTQPSAGTGRMALSIYDPERRITAVEFQKKVGNGDFGGSWLNTWDSSTGTAGVDVLLTRQEDTALQSGHQSALKWQVRWTDETGTERVTAGSHTFDEDMIADVTGFALSFRATDGIVIVSAEGDEDVANLYVTVGVDSAPADPTAGSNHGFAAGRTAVITTSVAVGLNHIAYVKVRGANAAASLGPVLLHQVRRSYAAPTFALRPSQPSLGSGQLIVEVNDPGRVVTAIEFQKKEGIGDFGGIWLTTWDSSIGIIGTDEALSRTEACVLQSGHQSAIKIRVSYTTESGATAYLNGAHSFDADLTPDVRGASLSFTDDGYILLSANLDEDCTEARATATVDGSAPATPDATNYQIVAPSSVTALTGVAPGVCPPGALARVKVRGANVTNNLWGPVVELQARAPAVGSVGQGIIAAYVIPKSNKLILYPRVTSGVGSFKWAVSTTSYPAAGTGTSVNTPVYSVDLGAATQGTLVYITLTPYTGAGATGTQLPAYNLQAELPWDAGLFTAAGLLKDVGDDFYVAAAKTMKVGTTASPSSITKTLLIPAGEIIPVDYQQAWVFIGGYLRPGIVNTLLSMQAALVLPQGVTITAFRARLYRGTTSDSAQGFLHRSDNTGSQTAIATLTHATTGWDTVAATGLSEVVGSLPYVATIQIKGVAAVTDARFLWIEVEYTMPDYAKAY